MRVLAPAYRAFTLMEAMVVLAIFSLITAAASSTFSSMLRSVKSSRQSIALSAQTKVALGQLLEEVRSSGGADLGRHGYLVVGKGVGQKGTDVFWTFRQNSEYSICSITAVDADRLTFQTFTANGMKTCCFQAGEEIIGTTPLHGSIEGGARFRRTAVIVDAAERIHPVFLSGDPSGASCELLMQNLPGVTDAIPAARRARLKGARVVLADVKRHYIDFDEGLEGNRPPLGILFSQVELDGNVSSFKSERLRISHGVADLRVGVGYIDGALELAEETDVPPLADSAILEREESPRGWRASPVANGAHPQMVGVAIELGAEGSAQARLLPWSTTPAPPEKLQYAMMVGRVALRNKEAP